uniref:Uncharacterized protein n=1 Tax=Myoviridae sp. ctXho31 TaxID=2825122 RepID=A0A8S5TWU5_9CAUD|nr:MAG TPA: hypothetical protein [Myoviridae sp. ctXho31]
MSELLKLCKQCLSIVETSTYKDKEINLLIKMAMSDLKRQGIDIKSNDSLIQGTIAMFVKANFGMVDIKEKELAQKTYNLLCNNLSLSSEYKEVEG